jgi:hypothetical protein
MKIQLDRVATLPDWLRGSKYGETQAGRLKNAKIIYDMFRKAGYPAGVALAAIVNARHESDLSNEAVGDSGSSVGLFQLHKNGAGKGMSQAERMDPYKNTARIIKETDMYGSKLMEASNAGASVADMSVIFGRDIERPANAGVGRDKTARTLLGPLADVTGNTLVYAAAGGFFLMGALGIAGFLGLLFLRR